MDSLRVVMLATYYWRLSSSPVLEPTSTGVLPFPFLEGSSAGIIVLPLASSRKNDGDLSAGSSQPIGVDSLLQKFEGA